MYPVLGHLHLLLLLQDPTVVCKCSTDTSVSQMVLSFWLILWGAGRARGKEQNERDEWMRISGLVLLDVQRRSQMNELLISSVVRLGNSFKNMFISSVGFCIIKLNQDSGVRTMASESWTDLDVKRGLRSEAGVEAAGEHCRGNLRKRRKHPRHPNITNAPTNNPYSDNEFYC